MSGEGCFGKEIDRISDTDLHDRQAFPLGKAFLLSRFSGLNGNTQSISRFAAEHGPHLGERPSHFWETGENSWRSAGGPGMITHNFPFPGGVAAVSKGDRVRGGEERTDRHGMQVLRSGTQ